MKPYFLMIFVPTFVISTLIPVFGQPSPDDSRPDSGKVTLIDFSETSPAFWQIVNDSVMGGISRSSLQVQEDGFAVFSGTVSLENNGGFASVRTQARNPADLSSFEGLSVKVLGDGKTYCLRIKTIKDGRITRYAYEARFTTSEGQWETHYLPFSSFKPVFRGFSVPGNPTLNRDAIIEIGFMIRDSQEGPFRLGVSELAAYW